MISFVWSSKQPFLAGRGGSENYTAGQIRELMRRGIPTRVLTLGFGEADGRDDFPDITFKALQSKEELSELDDTLVFVTYPLNVHTKKQSFAIMHCPPQRLDPAVDPDTALDKQLVAPSKFAARIWGNTLRVRSGRIPTVYPFAEPCFSKVQRVNRAADGKIRILFAGRLLPDKGIYTLLAALHMDSMKDMEYDLTVTDAAGDTDDGKIIMKLLEAHPQVNLIKARRSPDQMAELMARQDVVVLPTTNIFWQEIFGIVSVEAQHAGCRVVASNSGGLSETDSGGMILIKPDDPLALANGIVRAAELGPLTEAERLYASTKFTVQASVDSLLKLTRAAEKKATQPQLALPLPLPLLQKQGSLVREQFNVAISTISQLGSQLGGEKKLTQRNARNT